MKKMICFSILTAIIVTFSSCIQHYDAFPSALVSYFPYSENQQLAFANNNGDTTIMTVTEMYVSKEYTESFGMKCCWSPEMHFLAKNDTIYIRGSILIPFSPDGTSSEVKIGLTAGSLPYEANFAGDAYSTQILSQIGDTIQFIGDGHEAVVVLNEGVVKFYDIQRDCTWTLIK